MAAPDTLEERVTVFECEEGVGLGEMSDVSLGLVVEDV